jgi:uncharacterized membrane protein
MEDTLISIDSKYRDYTTYSNESKFTFTPEKIYKNVVSVKMVSLELTNTINYISSLKKNNYFTLYLPNKINDSVGLKIELSNTQLQDILTIKTSIDISLTSTTILSNNPERYFYIFYLTYNM